VTTWTRVACALAAFPLGWAVREAAGGAAGGLVVLALIGAAAWGLPRARAGVLAAAGVILFVAVHLIAKASNVYAGLAVGAILFAAAAFASGCGGDDGSATDGTPAESQPELTLALDFTPNAVHAPIYAAVREGIDRKAGIAIRIRTPGRSPDSLKDVLTGAADVGVLDIHDLGLAAVSGKDVVAVAALVQRPLAAIVAQPEVRRPRDLEGRRVGVSGLPSDPAVLDAVMRDDGGSIDSVEQVTIGFTAVQSLISGRIDAVPVFWNAEGVALRERGVKIREFRVDDYGAPAYPEVVIVARRKTVDERGGDIAALVASLAGGIEAVRRDPAAAVEDIAEASGSDEALVRAQLDAVEPILGTELDRATLEKWADWDVEFGILPRRPDVETTFALSP
jgi:NitT/TauT family transport system substrate-binding protein/putative hydroxymethylpyrimidine transport system substrate-binding protein